MSVHPEHVANMLSGRKTVELRRARPVASEGVPVLIYATTPQSAVVAVTRITSIHTDTPESLWPTVESSAAIGRESYYTYFRGSKVAVAIELAPVHGLDHPIELRTLANYGVRPPQTWLWLARTWLSDKLGDHPATKQLNRLLSQ